ncbi:Purine nucleoside phosphorylase DeoD-type [Buchnera aphidicola (Pterocallis alni)]|uniref:purine-nucleoside phosphorylase n=1 Tax=Buchnera aphidicola TaxID=9 RepID=UPI003464DFEC
MITPHINARKNDFSELVIMSGDPIRVRYIAENFLDNCIEVTNIRYMLGFTGYYKGCRVSVMSHGMGIPSAALYIEELAQYYHVKKIIRLGTCGTVQKNIKLKDIIIAMGACTDSSFNRNRFSNYDYSAIADFDIICNINNFAQYMGIPLHIGNFFTTDIFYFKDRKIYNLLKKYNILGIDMETAGFYSIAAEFNIKAMSMCCVSDHLKFNERLSSNDRLFSFNNMIKLSLDTITL